MANYEFTGKILPAGEITVKGEHLYYWPNPFAPGRYSPEHREETVIRHPELYQIRATRDIYAHKVKAGDLGGWIEKEENLKNDNCWIFPGAMVFGHAKVEDYAVVADNAIVYEKASICDAAKVSGSSIVRGETIVKDYAEVSGNAIVENTYVMGRSKVYGNAVVKNSTVDKDAQIYGYANIAKSKIDFNSKVCGTAQLFNTTTNYNAFCQGGDIRNSYLSDEIRILNADLIDYSFVGDNAIINGTDVYLKHAKIGEDALIENTNDHLGIMGAMPTHPLLGEAARPTEINFYKNQEGGITLLHDGFCCSLEDLEKWLPDEEPAGLADFFKAAAELAKMKIKMQTN